MAASEYGKVLRKNFGRYIARLCGDILRGIVEIY